MKAFLSDARFRQMEVELAIDAEQSRHLNEVQRYAIVAEREVGRVLKEAEPNVTPAPGLMFVMPWYGYHWRADWMPRPEREALAEAIETRLAEGAFDQ